MYQGLAALGTKKYMGLAALGTKMYQGQPALRYSLVLRAGCPRYKNVLGATSPRYIFGSRAGSPRSKEVNRAGCPIFNIYSIFQNKCPRASPNVIELNILKILNIQKNLGIFKFEYPNILSDIQVSWGISQCHRVENPEKFWNIQI